MGNTQSNKIDDHDNKISSRTRVPKSVHEPSSPAGQTYLQMQQIQNQKQNHEMEFDHDSKQKHRQSLQSRYINSKNLIVEIHCKTWYRDSHGLFDYEEEQKMTHDKHVGNKGFLLKRDGEHIIKEDYDDFNLMRINQKCISEMVPVPDDFVPCSASIFFKDNNYWIYHKNQIETTEEEKANPGDKLWLCMKHMTLDPDYNLNQGEGFKLRIGDTIKFGRVRYKVILMHNQKDGFQEYLLHDRFQRDMFVNEQESKYGKQMTRKRKRNSSGASTNVGASPRIGADGRAPSRRTTAMTDAAASLPRYQSQVTQFDNNLDQRNSFDESQLEGSLMGSEDNSSDHDNSSQYTDSEDVSSGEIDNLQTMQQAGISDVHSNNDDGAANRNGGEGPNFMLGKFNSIVPSNQGDKPAAGQRATGPRASLNFDAVGVDSNQLSQPNLRERHNTHTQQEGLDPNDLGRTGTFWFNGQSHVMQSGVGSELDQQNRRESHGNSVQTRNLGATQVPNVGASHHERKKQSRKRKNQKQKQNLKRQLKLAEQAKLALEGKVCRICLGEENEGTDPLISPCKCAGTMSHIHLECLREWLNSKRSKKEGEHVKTYCWKALECELCKVRFPGQVYPDGTILTEDTKLSRKQIAKLGQPIEILEYERPEADFIVVESVTLQNIRIVHVISMKGANCIRVGRGHDADIRVTDISVSRFHARINRNEDGEFFVEDNKSKFGTLMQLRKPHILHKNRLNYLQMGRTMLTIRIDDADLLDQTQKSGSDAVCGRIAEKLCCGKKAGKQIRKGITERQLEHFPAEWDPPSEEDVGEKQLNTQAEIENVKDENEPNRTANVQIEAGDVSNIPVPRFQEQQNNEEEKQAREQSTIRNQMESRIQFQGDLPQIPVTEDEPLLQKPVSEINSQNVTSLQPVDQSTVKNVEDSAVKTEQKEVANRAVNDTFDDREQRSLIKIAPGNESCAIVNESMFEEQKTDNNINIDQKITDGGRQINIYQNSMLAGINTNQKQILVNVLDENKSSLTENLDMINNSNNLGVNNIAQGFNNENDQSQISDNRTLQNILQSPENKRPAEQINFDTTMNYEPNEETKINSSAHLNPKDYSELVGGMRTGLTGAGNRKLLSVREEAGLRGDDLEQTYLNDEILLGNGLRTSQRHHVLDESQHQPSQFDNSQIHMSPNFDALKNRNLKINSNEKTINQSVQISQPKIQMKMHQINLSQDNTNDQKELTIKDKEMMEYTGGNSTMKNSSFHAQDLPGQSLINTGRTPHAVQQSNIPLILINEPELDGLQEEDKNQEKVKIVDDENAKIQIQQTNNAGDGENTK